MRAIVQERYGRPSVLQLREVAKPTPKDHEVLIRVDATAVTLAECAFRKGDPFVARLFSGLFRPRIAIPGDVVAGTIEAVGRAVTRFKTGDPVVGSACATWGAYAEYKCLPEDGALARRPAGVTAGDAAALCDGFLTALPFLRDAAHIQSGHRVLVNGASGSIGTVAVQLAKHFGADVTGVCSTANVELVRSLGADRVVDYTREDFTRNAGAYDVVFDTVGKSTFARCKRALAPRGVYLTTVPTLTVMLQMLWTARLGNKKAVFAATGLRPPSAKAKDLVYLGSLVAAGTIRTVVDRRYALEQMAEAHAYVEKGHKKGSVVATV
jgi:NADPH:quinone reductase-like Zn-dependent oxidoreductase